MFNIAQYLEKFRNLGGSERDFKKALILAVKEVVGVEIDIKDLLLVSGEVIIKVSPIIKNSIYIKKDKIIKLVQEKTGKVVSGIR